MGHFPQDGENEQNLSDFFFWSFTVTKRFDFLKFSQLFTPPPERALCLPKEPFAPSWIILEGILGSTDFDF